MNFIKDVSERERNGIDQLEEPRGYTSIPYIKGVSERIKRILSGVNIQTAFKYMLILGNVFRKPKDRPDETQVKGIVYKFKCKSCDFTSMGESKRSWRSRWAEHKPGTRRMIESSVKEHAETTGHDVQFDDVKILEKVIKNYHKRLFLESFHSCSDNASTNELLNLINNS